MYAGRISRGFEVFFLSCVGNERGEVVPRFLEPQPCDTLLTGLQQVEILWKDGRRGEETVRSGKDIPTVQTPDCDSKKVKHIHRFVVTFQQFPFRFCV